MVMDDATREAIKEVMTEVMVKERDTFWVAPKQQFLDHQQMNECREHKEEWLENHAFVSDVRKKKEQVESTSIKVLVVAICTSLIGFAGWFFDLIPSFLTNVKGG